MEVTIRPATRRDFEDWYEILPHESCRAWVAEADGKVLAIAGYTLGESYTYAFSSFGLEHGLPAKLVYSNAVKLFAEMKRRRLPLLAVACPARKNSGKLLRKLGFTLVEHSNTGDIYEWK